MTIDISSLVMLVVMGGIVAWCLFVISRIRSQAVHERGHLALSFAPWIHLLFSYAVAFYVRLGFGSWPRSCIDNPELPMLGSLVLCLVLGLLIIPFGGLLWLGWLILRLRRRMPRYWISSSVLFISGIVLMIAAQIMDPWGFWSWVWD